MSHSRRGTRSGRTSAASAAGRSAIVMRRHRNASSRSVSSTSFGALAIAKPSASGRHTSNSDTSKPGDASWSMRDARVCGSMASHETIAAASARCDTCTPLGLPVDPDVKRMYAGPSSDGTGVCGAHGRCRSASVRSGMRTSRHGAALTSVPGPTVSIMYASRSVGSVGSSGTYVLRAFHVARSTTYRSSVRGRCTYTAPPSHAARWPAYTLERRSSSAYDSVCATNGSIDVANVMASASGRARACIAKRARKASAGVGCTGVSCTTERSARSVRASPRHAPSASSSCSTRSWTCAGTRRSGAYVTSNISVLSASTDTCSASGKSEAIASCTARTPRGHTDGVAGRNEKSASKSVVSMCRACATSVRCTNGCATAAASCSCAAWRSRPVQRKGTVEIHGPCASACATCARRPLSTTPSVASASPTYCAKSAAYSWSSRAGSVTLCACAWAARRAAETRARYVSDTLGPRAL